MKKLNPLGFAHHILLLLIVAIVAIGGCYYLVSGHASTYGNPTTSRAICIGAHYRRTWPSGSCSRGCQTGYYHVTSSPFDWCAKDGTSSASPLSSPAICNGPNWNRVWKNGGCSHDCQPNYPVPIVADPYDYCKGGTAPSASTTPNPPATTVNKITVNGKTSTGGNILSLSFNTTTRLKIHVYGGRWQICRPAYKSVGLQVNYAGETCQKLALGETDNITSSPTMIVRGY